MLLHKYILKNHIAPFAFSIFTLFAVFLLQFMMKFADRLVGKGISFFVITKLIAFNLAWMVVLVVPMAVLVSTLMAFGSLAQNNEVAVMKASGMSLYKMMLGPVLASMVVAILLIQFNNHVYPDANHAARVLMQDISQKKPTLSLVPGVFSQEVQNYSILVRHINPITNELKDVTIYDNSDVKTMNIVTAKQGKIYFSKNNKKLLMDLYDGEIHESQKVEPKVYRKLIFEKHKIAMKADQFSFEQTGSDNRRSERELGAQHMVVIVDSIAQIRKSDQSSMDTYINSNFIVDTTYKVTATTSSSKKYKYALLRIEDRIKSQKSIVASYADRVLRKDKTINEYLVEIHKKYSLPVACIVFVLIGAPLGTMTRKGGFGMAAGISLLFFLIYWAFLIGGEKLSDRALLSPFWGMWSGNILFAVFGIWLTIKSAKERVTLDLSVLSRFIPKQFRASSENN